MSYFATCTCLSDKSVYPSFLRTVPSDHFQVRGLVQLVTFFGWFWVGTVGTTVSHGLFFFIILVCLFPTVDENIAVIYEALCFSG